jgi:c-di-GMP-binding flagellar brake protein YcgR
VYLWRKNDASYTFDTVVLNEGFSHDFPVLYLMHSDRVSRAQKRRSIRAAASIYGELFVSNGTDAGVARISQITGLKCLLEDISADGALIRVGGRAVKGLHVLLKFKLSDREIIMEGRIKGVEYNPEVNQSRLHFECEKIDTESKNIILSYVYNVLPQEEREKLERLEQVRKEAEDSEEQSHVEKGKD